jgi:2',3'-cyclic-nucleotide 2'-phosphodiesterase / 3'-nucleotidase
VRLRNISDLYSFPNTLVALALTGADVADWLEQSAALFRQITPGAEDAPLHEAAVPAFSFDVMPDLSYAIDLSQPARFDARGRLVNPEARRIVGLSLCGQPLDPALRLVLATNNHRASLAVSSQPERSPTVVLAEGTRMQDILADHVRTAQQVGAPPRRTWHFLPMPGTTVMIRSGAGSEAHLADIASYRPEAIGVDPDGFRHYRLHL